MVKREARRVISGIRIGIEAMAGETPLGDLERVWEAWVDGKVENRKSKIENGDGWDERTGRCMERLLGGYGAEKRQRMGLVLGTTKGDLDAEVRWIRRREAGSQKPEAGSVVGIPNLGGDAGILATSAGLGGGVWTVSTACTSGLMALIEAGMAVMEGTEKMVAMGADEVEVGEGFVRTGFRALKALSVKECRPFDVERDGLMLGSGAAACVVVPLPNQRAVCEIAGWGVSNDATHMTAPDREAGGLVRGMQAALNMAGIEAGEIDVVFAHGTGTSYNDAMEAVAIDKVFGKHVAVTAVKGLIGHTLGASGMIEALLAVRMIQEQKVPAIFGLRKPERGELDFVMETREMKVRRVMKVASGFGGMNAAVILSATTA